MLEKIKAIDIQKAIAMVAAGYGKAFADKRIYNQLMELELFKKIRENETLAKDGFIFGLHALTAVIDQLVDEDHPFLKMLKEIALDSGSEMARRLKNGAEGTAAAPQSKAEHKSLLAMLTVLEPEQIKAFAAWVTGTSQAERKEVLKRFETLTEKQFEKIGALPPDTLDVINRMYDKAQEARKPFRWDVALGPLIDRARTNVKKNEGGINKCRSKKS